MAINVGWAYAPDLLQGARGIVSSNGGVLYSFPEGQLDVPSIDIGTEAMDDEAEIRIVECHVHVRNDDPGRIHVTWKLQGPSGNRSDFYQWFTCTPGGDASYSGNGGMGNFLAANPDLNSRNWVARGEPIVDGGSAVDEHTLAYSTMLATELAATMSPETYGDGTARPTRESGVPLGWGYAPFTIGGARADLRGSDAVYVYGAPVAAANGWQVTSCEMWLSPGLEWTAQVSYRLAAPGLPLDVVHYLKIDGAGGVSQNGESLSADGSAPEDAEGAARASSELWPSSERIAAMVTIYDT